MEELVKIVAELKAPKNRKNTFGNYKYRSCEDILEAVKPLLAKHNCTLLITDEVVNIGGANYIKATATLCNSEGTVAQVSGYAREEMNKKGMDAPQMTGTSSSYARKYALNGLFCIDDTKDADTNEYRQESDKRAQKTATMQPQEEKVKNKLTIEQVKGREADFVDWLYSCYQYDKNMNAEQKIADTYDCDFATTRYLCDKFNEYLKTK